MAEEQTVINWGWLHIVGRTSLFLVSSLGGIRKVEHGWQKTEQKTSYEFIFLVGGGGWASWLMFLPTSALSLVVHPDKPEHTDKVYKTPKKRERGFKVVFTYAFEPFLVHPKLDWLRNLLIRLCHVVARLVKSRVFLEVRSPTSGVPRNTLLPFRSDKESLI